MEPGRVSYSIADTRTVARELGHNLSLASLRAAGGQRTVALTRCPSDGLEHIVMARGPCGPRVSSLDSSQAPCKDSAWNPLNKRRE